MQTRELTIKYLKKQLGQINKEDLESWLRTTVGYAGNYFGSNHQRIRDMGLLRLRIVSVQLGKSPIQELENVKADAIQYVNEFIDDLNDLKPRDEMEDVKVKYPLNLSQEVFWTVLIALVGGLFVLGIYIGGAKFDKEKIDYYNQIHQLENDTLNLNRTLNMQKDSLETFKTLQDSIQTLKDSIDIIKGRKHRVNGKVEAIRLTNAI